MIREIYRRSSLIAFRHATAAAAALNKYTIKLVVRSFTRKTYDIYTLSLGRKFQKKRGGCSA